MGMPTAAVYIVLATVIAPAIVDMKVIPIAAHLFLFYFGLLSMLTPPVAVASMVAAGLANADMWRTGLVGMRLAAPAYMLPFLWVYNPALLLEGTWDEIVLIIVTVLVGAVLLAQAGTRFEDKSAFGKLFGLALMAAAVAVGGATVWFGAHDLFAVATAIAGAVLALISSRLLRAKFQDVPTTTPQAQPRAGE
jgi:TRAP-type uncharacterized transport system fused permease subunit